MTIPKLSGLCLYHDVPWIVAILQDSILSVQRHLLHVFLTCSEMLLGLLPSFFFTVKICGLGWWPFSSTACPVSKDTCSTHFKFHVFLGSWLLAPASHVFRVHGFTATAAPPHRCVTWGLTPSAGTVPGRAACEQLWQPLLRICFTEPL